MSLKQELHGDCLYLYKTLNKSSVDLILTDLPYGNVKGIELNESYYKIAKDRIHSYEVK